MLLNRKNWKSAHLFNDDKIERVPREKTVHEGDDRKPIYYGQKQSIK